MNSLTYTKIIFVKSSLATTWLSFISFRRSHPYHTLQWSCTLTISELSFFLFLSLSLSLYIPDNSFVSHISLIKWAKGTFYALIFRSCFLLSRLAQNVLLFDGDVIARGIKQMVDIFYVLYVHINAFMRKIWDCT